MDRAEKRGILVLDAAAFGLTEGLFVCFLLLLAALAASSTSMMRADASEHTYFLRDSIAMNVLAAGAVMLLARFLGRCKGMKRAIGQLETSEACFAKCRRILLMGIFFLCLFWSLCTRYVDISDQREIQEAAVAIAYREYRFPYLPGCYLSRYPNQIPITWMFGLLIRFWGEQNFFVIQALNGLLLALFYRELSLLGARMGLGHTGQILIILLGYIFFPWLLYTTFIYGTVPSATLGLAGMRQWSRFYDEGGKRPLILGIVFLILAVLLKQNAMILALACAFAGIMEFFRQGKRRTLLGLPCAVVILYLCTAVPPFLSRIIIGEDFIEGTSKWAWVAMGMQEGFRAPGWYNEYNAYTYEVTSYNARAQEEIVREEIRTRLERFRKDPGYAADFFLLKTASQWNNPTFQALWLGQVRESVIQQPRWVRRLSSAIGADYLGRVLNLVQFTVLVLSLLGLAKCRRGSVRSMLTLSFVGGFLFHLLWEAKCQYTIGYFVLLFPFAVLGLRQCCRAAITKGAVIRTAAMAAVVLLLGTLLPRKCPALQADDAQYRTYLSEVRAGKWDKKEEAE